MNVIAFRQDYIQPPNSQRVEKVIKVSCCCHHNGYILCSRGFCPQTIPRKTIFMTEKERMKGKQETANGGRINDRFNVNENEFSSFRYQS